jgi:hypothetical protein
MWRILLILAGLAVSSRGGKYGFVYPSRQRVYKALRRKGMTKKRAAMISNAGRFHSQRSRMAKKAARTRRMRGGH